MNLYDKGNVKKIFREYNISPLKRLGQNFLVDKIILKKFIKTINPQPNDIILEIGPGIGTITQELAPEVKEIIAVEKDLQMCKILEESLKESKNVQIINADILKFNISKYKKHRIVGSLPFYITVHIIRKFLESKNPPKEMILIIQKEVAQRICASIPKMNLLAVSVQFYAQVKTISYISKKSFLPSPKVDSAIIKITPCESHVSILPEFQEQFFKTVKAGFLQPRKQLVNNLSKGLKLNKEKTNSWLLKNDIDPSRRAETLDIKDWIKLTKSKT